MKEILFTLIIVLFCIHAPAQRDSLSRVKRNGIYAEWYGIRHDFSTGFISLNYERQLGKKKKYALRLGLYPDFETTVSFPVTFTRITRPDKNHHFEFGLGAVYRLEFYEGNVYKDLPAIMFPLMYRYQKSEGCFFRAGINLFVSWPTIPSPSFSAGYRF